MNVIFQNNGNFFCSTHQTHCGFPVHQSYEQDAVALVSKQLKERERAQLKLHLLGHGGR